MPEITKDMMIKDVLEMDNKVIPVFFKHGLHCMGCALASGETLEQACEVHSLDCDTLISDLNEFFEAKAES